MNVDFLKALGWMGLGGGVATIVWPGLSFIQALALPAVFACMILGVEALRRAP